MTTQLGASARLWLSTLAAVFLTGCFPEPQTPAVSAWSDPEGFYTVDLPGTPASRDVQEITAQGTVNYRVYGINTECVALVQTRGSTDARWRRYGRSPCRQTNESARERGEIG